jgi:predicted CxxxxCH...CXXCH cytochrome family protein
MRWITVVTLCLPLFACTPGTIDAGGGDPDNPDIPAGRHHPLDFLNGAVHGPELNLQAQDCRACHGLELTGNPALAAPSCDGCHNPVEPTAWRSDCLYCHGGTDNDSGAPPRDLDGNVEGDAFPAHSAHMGSALLSAIECADCHVTPGDVLSEGHVFDDTPGAAEVAFAAGRSPVGTFDAAGQGCANLYCHGNGRGDNGVVASNDPPMSCASCHADGTNGTAGLSGEHGEHVGDIGCQECHSPVTADGSSILDAALHIDGERAVSFLEPGVTLTREGDVIRCSGVCHGEDHQNESW